MKRPAAPAQALDGWREKQRFADRFADQIFLHDYDPTQFGKYLNTLTTPRFMQFALRFVF